MWTRAELKGRAKAGLKQYYWYGVLMVLAQGAIAGGASLVASVIPLVNFVAGPVVSLFVVNVLTVGFYNYFIQSTETGRNAGIDALFSGFKGNYMNVVATMFFKGLFQFLWSLLFVIPGIIKSYEYCMVPYLAAEFPDKDRKELFAMSKQMMDGNKFDTFILGLSFIGWILLGLLPCGLGLLFVIPYIQATMAELYLQLKEERLGMSRGNAGFDATAGTMTMTGDRYMGITDAGNAYGTAKGFLVGVQGEFTGADIPVDLGSPLTVGRDSTRCNLVVNGAQVSAVHVKVEFNGRCFVVTDYSEAGTFDLQHGRLAKGQPTQLQSGAYLQLGTGGDVFSLVIR